MYEPDADCRRINATFMIIETLRINKIQKIIVNISRRFFYKNKREHLTFYKNWNIVQSIEA